MIETTALGLFARDGYDSTTIEAITAACEVSPRTFFRYFAGKHDLLRPDAADIDALLDERPLDEPPLHSLREVLRALAAHYEDERATVLLRLQVLQRNPELGAGGLESPHAWQRAVLRSLGDRMPAFEARVAAAAAMAAFTAAVAMWSATGGTGDLVALTLEAFDRLGGGLDG